MAPQSVKFRRRNGNGLSIDTGGWRGGSPALAGIRKMPVLAAPWAALAWLGRQGTRAIAAVVFLAIVVPPLDAVLRPFVTEAIFALLCIAFVRVDTVDLRTHFKKPGLVLTATAWTSLVLPSLIGVGCLLTRLDVHSPDLFLAIMLQAIASPMMAAP